MALEELVDDLSIASDNTLIQAVVYDEVENFQSYADLENFFYPFKKRKQTRNEYAPTLPINSTEKFVDQHTFLLQKSVVCL
jgi:hypothetical protein